MPTVWWDDPTQFRIDAGTGTYGGSVPEEIPRSRWSDWDKLAIGGMEMPGHVVVFTKKEKKNDVLTAPGQDGATINHLGVDPVDLDITVTLWTPAQFTDYERLVHFVLPRAFPVGKSRVPSGIAASQFVAGQQSLTGDPLASAAPTVEGPPKIATAFEVRHPPLNMLGVTSIYIYEVGSLIPGPVFGSKVTVWRAREQKAPTQITIQASSGEYASQLLPSQGRPTATQPVTRPSVSAVGP